MRQEKLARTHTLYSSEFVLKYKHESWISFQQNNMLSCLTTNRRLYKTADASLHGKHSDIPKDTRCIYAEKCMMKCGEKKLFTGSLETVYLRQLIFLRNGSQ